MPAAPQLTTAAATRPAAGFTLLELMAVVGVIAILMGVGLGFLGRSTGLPETRVAIGAELRLAALDARTRGLPTEVVLTAGQGLQLSTVKSRALQPIAVYGFETGQAPADADLQPRIGGERAEFGRFGEARRPAGEEAGAVLTLPLPPSTADLRDGFAVRMDLFLEARDGGQVLQLGEGLAVHLDQAAAPRVRLVTRGLDGRAGDAYNLQPDIGLPIGRWCQFEVGADGSNLWCAVDGRVLERTACTERLHQTNGDNLLVLPTAEPLPGIVDEVQLFAYVFSEPVPFQQGLVLEESVRVQFDVLGRATASGPIRLQVIDEDRTVEWTVGVQGVLQ